MSSQTLVPLPIKDNTATNLASQVSPDHQDYSSPPTTMNSWYGEGHKPQLCLVSHFGPQWGNLQLREGKWWSGFGIPRCVNTTFCEGYFGSSWFWWFISMLVSSELKATSESITMVHVTPAVLHYRQRQVHSFLFWSGPQIIALSQLFQLSPSPETCDLSCTKIPSGDSTFQAISVPSPHHGKAVSGWWFHYTSLMGDKLLKQINKKWKTFYTEKESWQ